MSCYKCKCLGMTSVSDSKAMIIVESTNFAFYYDFDLASGVA